ncbi:MAG: hypothetical protein K2V38_01315, partial [Gemmataceae bacterium]|nr:hypothetical protein [Gemmataceae bacterium]
RSLLAQLLHGIRFCHSLGSFHHTIPEAAIFGLPGTSSAVYTPLGAASSAPRPVPTRAWRRQTVARRRVCMAV